VHRAEGDQVGVFELSEAELGLGLGAVGSDHLGDRPVVPVGDQDAFAEDLGFQVDAGVLVEVEAQPVLGWSVVGEFPADDAADSRFAEDLGDLGFDLVSGSAGVAAGQRVGQRGQPRLDLGQGL